MREVVLRMKEQYKYEIIKIILTKLIIIKITDIDILCLNLYIVPLSHLLYEKNIFGVIIYPFLINYSFFILI